VKEHFPSWLCRNDFGKTSSDCLWDFGPAAHAVTFTGGLCVPARSLAAGCRVGQLLQHLIEREAADLLARRKLLERGDVLTNIFLRGREQKSREQNRIGWPKNRNWMWSESQRESNFRSEKIASEDKQRDGKNAPIKKLVATPVCFRM
jgi:hypothetical protein